MIPWVTSAGTLLAVWLSGRNLRLSWKVSLANQGMWLVFIVTYDAWGLLPLDARALRDLCPTSLDDSRATENPPAAAPPDVGLQL